MQRRRLFVGLFSLAFLAVGVAPAAAASSVSEELIRGLNSQLIAVAVPITLIVEGILVYTVWKYRNAEEAKPTLENRRLEVTWTITTALVLLFVGVAAYSVMAAPSVTATEQTVQEAQATGDPVVVEAHGVQWYWNFNYSSENVTTQRNTLVVPTDRTVVIETTSAEVLHAVHVPELALKADAMPGQTNYIQTTITEEGEYQLYCAEYCGQGHSAMLATVHVVSPEEYDNWVEDPQNSSAPYSPV
jgi:cytochrome c oxidase subunit 2